LLFKTPQAPAFLVAAVYLVHLSLQLISGNSTERRLGAVAHQIKASTRAHLETLTRRRNILIRIDHYGVINRTAWDKELLHVLRNVISPQLSQEQAELIAEIGESRICLEIMDPIIEANSHERRSDDFDLKNLTPQEFEGLCSQILSEHGWKSSTTSGSGDQGADVIARKGKKKLILQCKLYKSTVGNKAVQEAISAKIFYGAQIGAVVCIKGYTKSAKQLAAASDIALLTLEELKDYAKTQ